MPGSILSTWEITNLVNPHTPSGGRCDYELKQSTSPEPGSEPASESVLLTRVHRVPSRVLQGEKCAGTMYQLHRISKIFTPVKFF